jgi:S-formylglutathione hydrolase FrmB
VKLSRRFKFLSLIVAGGLVIAVLTMSNVTGVDANGSQVLALAKTSAVKPVGTITSRGSRIVSTRVKGSKSHLTDTVITVLPREYDLPQNAHRTFPYLVMYSGMPGSAGSWVSYLDIATHLEDVEGDTLTPVIAVLVPVYFNYDTECIDFKGYPQTGSWIGTDIPKWINLTWRVSHLRDDHVLAGFSAGGWCAAMQATMNPGSYRAVMTFAGYFAPTFDQAQLLNNDPHANRFILAKTIAKTVQPISFFIGAARDDPISYPSGKYFSRAVKNKAIKITYEEIPSGGHSFAVWEQELVDALDWLPLADHKLAFHRLSPGATLTPSPTLSTSSSTSTVPSPK